MTGWVLVTSRVFAILSAVAALSLAAFLVSILNEPFFKPSDGGDFWAIATACLVIIYFAGMALVLWSRNPGKLRLLFWAMCVLCCGFVGLSVIVEVNGGRNFENSLLVSIVIALPVLLHLLLRRTSPMVAVTTDRTWQLADIGASPTVKAAGLLVVGALAFQGVISLLRDEDPVAAPVVTVVPTAPTQPAVDQRPFFSVMSSDNRSIRLHSGRSRTEAHDGLCSGCRVVAEGQGRCGAFLEFLLPWNKSIYAIADSTAAAEERVLRICQMRDATSRDCSGVRSFCSGE